MVSRPVLRTKCPQPEFAMVRILLHSDQIRRGTDTFHVVLLLAIIIGRILSVNLYIGMGQKVSKGD